MLFLTLAIQLRCLARPFIGSGLATKSTTLAEQIVRFARAFGQILSAPQRLPFINYIVFGKRMKNHDVW
ncbi:hypothetical protein ASJ83_07885 [Methanocorpusculum parvum]|uniref:Secreted protein n=1 Tax=Methanocorpusculum parvum TaxID=2193 RepID=A0AAX0Q7M3_9EURY|nr:hypothetical protein ASJ83_07885 [Methanocorpusculum parvum]